MGGIPSSDLFTVHGPIGLLAFICFLAAVFAWRYALRKDGEHRAELDKVRSELTKQIYELNERYRLDKEKETAKLREMVVGLQHFIEQIGRKMP